MVKFENRMDTLELSLVKLESRLDGAEIGVGSVEKMVSNIIKHCGETSIQYELLQESIGNLTNELRNSIKQISKAHQLTLIFHFLN
ncbi:hypothetical protein CYJ36_11330 [Bacillus sp. UMB0893]|nr:hypothetical protein CYJ36_11330 [Bacillus sp. UMB0893]